MTRREHPFVVGVVGPSGAGKTTLLERLIPALASRGLRVGAVKHASHGFLADRPGKDSHRLYEAGADSVAVVSREQIATFVRSGPETPPSLASTLATLPSGLDAVLVEGFAKEALPRIVLGTETAPGDPARSECGEVLARVDCAHLRDRPGFEAALVETLARAIEARCRGSARARTGTHPRKERPCFEPATSPAWTPRPCSTPSENPGAR